MTKQPELKPCPFCGGEAEIQAGYVMFNDIQIGCVKCAMTGPNFDGMHCLPSENLKSAAIHWNTRA